MAVGAIPALVFVFNPDLPIALGAAVLMEGLGMGLIVGARNRAGGGAEEAYAAESGGLRRTGKNGSTLIPWSEIAEVYAFHSMLSSHSKARVVTKSGETIELNSSTENHMELARQISEGANVHLLAAARAALRDGREVGFGEVRISRQGVTYKNTAVPWGQVAEAGCGYDHRLKGDVFEVTEKGRSTLSFRVMLHEIPNVEVFQAILAEARQRLPRENLPSPAPPAPPSDSAPALGTFDADLAARFKRISAEIRPLIPAPHRSIMWKIEEVDGGVEHKAGAPAECPTVFNIAPTPQVRELVDDLVRYWNQNGKFPGLRLRIEVREGGESEMSFETLS
jgi:hypothetical protein